NCHGVDARGQTVLGRAMKLRDLGSPEVQNRSDQELIEILSKGSDRGKMPGFGKEFDAETIRQVVTHLRHLDSDPQPGRQRRVPTELEPGGGKSVYFTKCAHCHG